MAAKAPSRLKEGDTVLIIATARKVSRDEIAPAISILEAWGLRVEEGPSLYLSSDQFAGNDDSRASDLQWALDHPEAKAILIGRGGYGTLRIIDKVNFGAFEKNPKWIVGFSDVTILQNHVHNLGFQSIHGTMPFIFSNNGNAVRSLRDLLFGKKVTYDVPLHPSNRAGAATGELVGGNLSILYALTGSASELDYKGKILFFEDLDEYLYHVDRMMLSLKRAGRFEKLAGVVVGGLSGMRDNSIPFGKTAEEIVSEHLLDYPFPVCFGFPAGHIEENIAFYHGAQARLTVGKNGTHIEFV